jgi:hypothetical protein
MTIYYKLLLDIFNYIIIGYGNYSIVSYFKLFSYVILP